MKAWERVVYRFGAFLLVPSERALMHEGEPVALPGKAFDLLVALASQPGHLLTKDELLTRVWPGIVVEEVNLSVNMSAIRKALARVPAARDWIETVPRRGYRFKAPVVIEDVATLNIPEFPLDATAGEVKGLPLEVRNGPARTHPWTKVAAVALALALAFTVMTWSGLAQRQPPSYAVVAVLPFAVDNAGAAHIADGLAEEAISALTRLDTLRVVPRASAFRWRGADPVEAGRRLAAGAVVTGTLAQQGERLSLRVELVDVERAAQTWSTRYEIAASELPELQGRLVDDLVRSLRARESTTEARRKAGYPTRNGAAYQAYLQGRFLWNQRSESELRGALKHFHHAIELDPTFALAHAALADTYTTLGYLSYDAPAATFPIARSHALKAIEIEPLLAHAHASLAYIRFYFDWDWSGAAEAFQRAVELNPNDPSAHQWYAVYLLAAGRADQAMHEIRTAQRLDPLSLAINTDVGFHLYYNGHYRDAIAQLQTVLGMKADFGLAHLWLARSYVEVGAFQQSLEATARAEAAAPKWPVLVAARGYTLGIMGRSTEANSVLDEMASLSGQRFVTAYGMALVHTGMGDKDGSFRWLERAFAERSHWLVWLRLDPRWKSLRDDPRFAELVRRMKYPT